MPLTVAGTKGKGSTVRFAEAALCAHGRPTLAFTSPHVSSVLERWRIDGGIAEASVVAEACREVAAQEAREAGAGPLTYFERTFAVACCLARARPDTRFLLEVGLGGRLDCANALDCAVAVLTHLSHDHREVLGPTLGHIAREKLAIMRPGRPLVVAPQTPEAADAIRAALPPSSEVVWAERPPHPLPLALAGAHQQENAATAWQAVQRLDDALDQETALAGMAQARLAARCQLLVRAGCRILVDGAHNGPSIHAALEVARHQLAPGFAMILGLAKEKEIEEILAVIPQGVRVRRCGYASPRARTQADWPPAATAWPWHADIASALDSLPGGDVLITGSFYLAGEALDCLGAAGDLPG